MQIKEASEADVQSLMNLELALYKKWDAMDKIDNINERWFLSENHKQSVISYLNSKSNKLFICLVDNKTVGYLKAEIKEREPFLKKVGHISETFIFPDFRGKKIGSELLSHALTWFKENKLIWTTVSTHSLDEEANNFWQRKGYKEFNKTFKMKI